MKKKFQIDFTLWASTNSHTNEYKTLVRSWVSLFTFPKEVFPVF